MDVRNNDNFDKNGDLNQPDPGQPLPRPPRKRRRSKDDIGLPNDSELADLARAYLERQRKHWPKLVTEGLIPAADDSVIVAMIDDFKRRHRGEKVDPESVEPFRQIVRKLGGDYSRYSCDNSTPKSILDQMVNALDKAHEEGRFVPWQYVFADYSLSGLNPQRRGYLSYKEVLRDGDHHIETTYIDDFTRASARRKGLYRWPASQLPAFFQFYVCQPGDSRTGNNVLAGPQVVGDGRALFPLARP